MYTNLNVQNQYILPTKGDVAVAGAGALYSTPPFRGASVIPLIAPGTLVVGDRETNASLGVNPSLNNVSVGVGIDLNNDGVTDYYRWADDIRACGFEAAEARPAACGQSAIVDLFFDCVECGVTYTVEVWYESNVTDGFGKENRGWMYSFSYTPPCPDCDGCGTTVDADQLMCGLYNAVNLGENGEWNIKLNGELLPADHEFPFFVSKLYDDGDTGADTTYEFNLAPSDSASTCTNCINFQNIKGISSAGTPAIDTVFADVVGAPLYVDDGGTNFSRQAHLELIAEQITFALDGNGDARAVKCVGKCCEWKIEVNTCITDFVLYDDADSPIAPTNTSNPFTAIDVHQECEDCDHPATTKKFTAGLRFRNASEFITCDCLAGNFAKADYSANLKVFPKFGFNDAGGWHVIRQQEQAEPTGQGIEWQKHEFKSLKESGEENIVRGLRGGEHWVPMANDPVKLVQTECNQKYCVISFRNAHKVPSPDPMGSPREIRNEVYILVPDGNTTASASIETFLTNYMDLTCSDVTFDTSCVVQE